MPVITVPAGQSQVVPLQLGRLTTVSAIPGGGGTAKVESSITPDAAQTPASANWFAWDAGTVSSATQATLYGAAIALRLTAAVAAATFEVQQ